MWYYDEEQDYNFVDIGKSGWWYSIEYISSLDLKTSYSKTQKSQRKIVVQGYSLKIFLHKNAQFIVYNCKLGQHNQQNTFRLCKLQHKTTLINIPYTGLKVKGRKKGKTKIPSPYRQIRMVWAVDFRQDTTLCGSTKMKLLFLPFNEPNLLMIT